MKPAIKPPALAAALLMATASTAQADYYDGSATLTYTINNISNSDGILNDQSNLSITGSFQQPTDATDFYASISGDGTYSANNPTIAATPLTSSSVTNTYSVSAAAVNGSVNTQTNGYYSLDFNNTSVNSYTIDLTLAYVLSTDAGGASLSSGSSVTLNYWYTGANYSVVSFTNSLYGFGTDTVGTNPLDTGHIVDSQQQPGSAELVFTLAPGENEQFITNASVYGNVIAATVTAVPVPAAVWIFGSGLLGLASIRQRNHC